MYWARRTTKSYKIWRTGNQDCKHCLNENNLEKVRRDTFGNNRVTNN